MLLLVLFALLWTLCTARNYPDYYYQPGNESRSTPVGLAAYRSALTLDWLQAEDTRQRELASAFESNLKFPSPIAQSDCMSYKRPTTNHVARLMLEMLKNLEGDDGTLVAGLVQALVRAKLLMLDTDLFENEPDLDALVNTPNAMIGEPHTTFPRIIEVLWMAVTDPSTVKKHGWCTIQKMTSFLQLRRPAEIAKRMRGTEQVVSRARFVIEEFIQHITPLNLLKTSSRTSSKEYPAQKDILTRSVRGTQSKNAIHFTHGYRSVNSYHEQDSQNCENQEPVIEAKSHPEASEPQLQHDSLDEKSLEQSASVEPSKPSKKLESYVEEDLKEFPDYDDQSARMEGLQSSTVTISIFYSWFIVCLSIFVI